MHCWTDLQSVHRCRCYDNVAPNAKCQRVLVLALCLVSSSVIDSQFASPTCFVFSGLRSRRRATAWVDNSTAPCDFSSIVEALHNQQRQPLQVPQDASPPSPCVVPMFIGATRTGMPLFCVTFSLRFLCLAFCRKTLALCYLDRLLPIALKPMKRMLLTITCLYLLSNNITWH